MIFVIRFLLLLLSILLVTSSSSLFSTLIITRVAAGAPPFDCQCYNGAVRDSSAANGQCRCVCPATTSPLYVGPYCVFSASSKVKLAITWDNSTTAASSSFSVDTTQTELRNYLAKQFTSTSDFDPQLDLSWVSRLSRFEDAKRNEVVVLYLVKGRVVQALMDDIADGAKITVASRNGFTYNAIDSFVTGLTVAAPGVFARHYATGNILGSIGVGKIYGDKDNVLAINDRQIEFFIGALCVILFCPIFEGVIMYMAFHPTPQELLSEFERQQAQERIERARERMEETRKRKEAAKLEFQKRIDEAGPDYQGQSMDEYINENFNDDDDHNNHNNVWDQTMNGSFAGTVSGQGSLSPALRQATMLRKKKNPLAGANGEGDDVTEYDYGYGAGSVEASPSQQPRPAPEPQYGYQTTSEPTTPHQQSSQLDEAGHSVTISNIEDEGVSPSPQRRASVKAKPKPKAIPKDRSGKVMNFSDFM